MKLYHWYHIYSDGAWEGCWEEHVQALTNCGLLDELTRFTVGIVGESEQGRDRAAEIVQRVRPLLTTEVEIGVSVEQGWEMPTIHHMQEHLPPFGAVFYAHTKGAASNPDIFPQKDWREWLSYHTITNWRECVHSLALADLAVPNWMTHRLVDSRPIPGVSGWSPGTYWWAKASYLRSLPRCPDFDRWQSETWIGLAPTASVYQQDCRPFQVSPQWFALRNESAPSV